MATATVNIVMKELNLAAVNPTRVYPDNPFLWYLHSSQDVTIQPGETKTVSIGIALNLPAPWVMDLLDRNVPCFPPCVHAGYETDPLTGEIRIRIYNKGDYAYHIAVGMPIVTAELRQQFDIAFKPDIL